MSPAAVQQQAIQEDAPAAVESAVDTVQADVATPEVYEDDQQFGRDSICEADNFDYNGSPKHQQPS